MDLQYAFLCEAATVGRDGKLNVLGIFNRIGFSQFPAKMHRIILVIACKGGVEDFGIHELEVRLMNPDGKNIVDPLKMHIEIEPDGGSANVVGEYNGLDFPNPGPYSFEILLDNQHFTSLELEVAEMQND